MDYLDSHIAPKLQIISLPNLTYISSANLLPQLISSEASRDLIHTPSRATYIVKQLVRHYQIVQHAIFTIADRTQLFNLFRTYILYSLGHSAYLIPNKFWQPNALSRLNAFGCQN